MAFSGSALAAEEPIKLVNDVPDRYIVTKGDTLWGIAGKFLQEPWRWPEIWRINKRQIKNPHLIYPGDVVLLDYVNGRPRLRLAKAVGVERLSPTVHSEQIAKAVPSIPANIIEPFISRPLVVTENELAEAPQIIGVVDESHVIAGLDDEIFVNGLTGDHKLWSIYRLGKQLRDPDAKVSPETVQQEVDATTQAIGYNKVHERETQYAKRPWPCVESRCDLKRPSEGGVGKLPPGVLGYEVIYLGSARLEETGEVSVLKITSAKEEIRPGDLLVAADPPMLFSYVPHKMETDAEGRLMSFYGGVDSGGPLSIITMTLGEKNGVEPGHVLGVYRSRSVTYNDENGERKTKLLPEKRYGLVFVFRVFDRVSYGLVMEASHTLQIGDLIRNP
jgi:hypothetical protein